MANRVDFFFKYADPEGSFAEVDASQRIELQRQRLAALEELGSLVSPLTLFTRDPERLLADQQALEAAGATGLPDLTTWFRGTSKSPAEADALGAELSGLDGIEIVHKPRFVGRAGVGSKLVNQSKMLRGALRRAQQRLRTAVRKPPDDSRLQRYLLSSESGVGIVDLPGWPRMLSGADVTICVIDDCWMKAHPSLNGISVRAISGVCGEVDDHGTEVLGVVLAPADGVGIVGIAPGAELVFAYPYARASNGKVTYSVADAIDRGTSYLRPGDVLLIERQLQYLPVEIVPACVDAIAHAVAKGVHVIEPAGNGGKNLDAETDFDSAHDSGAILVGAGVDASPVRGRRRGASTLSNFGARVTVQAWGAGVLTSASHEPAPPDASTVAKTEGYANFGGTSAASAIVAGVVALSSAIAKKLDPGHEPLDPPTLRELLVASGAEQHPATVQRHIGPQPDLNRMARAIRRHLYDRHQIPEPGDPKPDLDRSEIWVLRLVASGLSDGEIGKEMRLGAEETNERLRALADKLGTSQPLEQARIADHWGFV